MAYTLTKRLLDMGISGCGATFIDEVIKELGYGKTEITIDVSLSPHCGESFGLYDAKVIDVVCVYMGPKVKSHSGVYDDVHVGFSIDGANHSVKLICADPEEEKTCGVFSSAHDAANFIKRSWCAKVVSADGGF